MAVSYKKLWKLLIDKDMKKSDLEREARITHYALSKPLMKAGSRSALTWKPSVYRVLMRLEA